MPPPPPRIVNLADWYWIVGGDATQVYSSAADAFVPVADPAYQAWLANGNTPTSIANVQDLTDLLYAAGQPLPPGQSPSSDAKDAAYGKGDAVALKILFNHENRIRALESKPPLTAPQFVVAVKQLL